MRNPIPNMIAVFVPAILLLVSSKLSHSFLIQTSTNTNRIQTNIHRVEKAIERGRRKKQIINYPQKTSTRTNAFINLKDGRWRGRYEFIQYLSNSNSESSRKNNNSNSNQSSRSSSTSSDKQNDKPPKSNSLAMAMKKELKSNRKSSSLTPETLSTIQPAITTTKTSPEIEADIDSDILSQSTSNTDSFTIEQVEQQERELLTTIIKYKKNNSLQAASASSTQSKQSINGSIYKIDREKGKPSLESFTGLIENWLSFPEPSRAEDVIDKMEEMYHVSGRIYERVINAWSFEAVESSLLIHEEATNNIDNANGSDDGGNENQQKPKPKNNGIISAKRAFDLLNRMEQLYEATGDLDFRPALSTYTSVINAIKRTSVVQTNNHLTNMNVNKMKRKKKIQYDPSKNEDAVEIDDQNNYVEKQRKQLTKAEEEIVKRANVMMEQMRQQRDRVYNQSDIDHMDLISPHQVFYVLKYLETGDDVMQRLRKKQVEDAFSSSSNRQRNSNNGSNNSWIPIVSRYNFNIIINELANEGKSWASQAAEEILDCMIHCHVSTYPSLKPNIETINACMNAWAQCTTRSDSAERAEGILKKLNSLQMTEGLLLDVTPDTVSYNSIVKAHANNGDAKKAEEVLNIMEDLYKSTKDEKIRPDMISFSSVLNAYAKAARYDQNAPRTAERILMRMLKDEKETENDDQSPVVNVWSFNAVLNAYAAQGAGLRAMLLLQLMKDMAEREGNDLVRPDTYSYNTVLKALAKSKEKGSIAKALQILEEMEERSSKGDLKVKPDGVSYNTVILAIANNRGRGSGKSAERILQRMERQYYSGHEASKPTSATYTSLIKAWTWEKSSTRRAEEIVNKLRKGHKGKQVVVPDTSIYNALLNCYAKSGERFAAKRAEEIIQTMLQEYSETGDETIKPNFRTYTTAIDVYSKSQEKGVAEKALGILEQMEKLQEDDSLLRPNVYTYAAVINCFARSNETDKAVKAVSILQQMEEQYRSGNDSARPNIVVYNSVLNACAYTTGEQGDVETAFKIACLVFDEVRSSDYVEPTHITYATFIQICGNFMPESDIRNNLVEATFKRCAQEGLVSKLVWKKVRIAASPALLNSLESTATKDNNEAKWSRNS